MGSRVVGVGAYLPPERMTNSELAATYKLDTSDAWMVQRTGIRQRHVMAPDLDALSMAEAAARAAIDACPAGTMVDGIILASMTPDQLMPSQACRLQAALGLSAGPAMDLNAACSGYVYALVTADAWLKAGICETVLVVGVDAMSRMLDWTDRGTCVLFGDGAGALVLRHDPGSSSGVLAAELGADGSKVHCLYAEGSPLRGETSRLRMDGREVFKHAVRTMEQLVERILAQANLTADAITWLVPHQANIRILQALARHLGMDEERVVMTVDQHANTSAASIPLAFAKAVCDGRIQRGDTVLMEAFGAGFTYGAALLRY